MSFIEPLDFYQIFVNTFAGSITIFSFVGIVLISGLAARFKMPNIVFGVMLIIYAMIFSDYVKELYLIAILITGFLAFNAFAQLFK